MVIHLRLSINVVDIGAEEDEGEIYEEEAYRQHWEVRTNFLENSWGVCKTRAINSNMGSFSRYMESDLSWLSEGSLA